MSKKVRGVARLLIPAGKAAPSAAIGQALGPLGVNMMEFCKAFNAKTQNYKENIPIPVKLKAYEDKTFEFITKTPQTTWFLKKAAGIEKGSARPGEQIVGTVNVKQIYEIGKIKATDEHLDHLPLSSICRSIVASARSMGLNVVK